MWWDDSYGFTEIIPPKNLRGKINKHDSGSVEYKINQIAKHNPKSPWANVVELDSSQDLIGVSKKYAKGQIYKVKGEYYTFDNNTIEKVTPSSKNK